VAVVTEEAAPMPVAAPIPAELATPAMSLMPTADAVLVPAEEPTVLPEAIV